MALPKPSNVIPLRPAPIPDPGPTLDELQRAYIEVELGPRRFSPSTLIAMLATATPIERGEIIRELAGAR